MKRNFKKIISLVLTVIMLLGTMSVLIPITASAEDTAIYLTPNEDNNINGQIYRFQTKYPETSYAKIENGKLILNMAKNDVLWIPSLTVKDATSTYTFENMTTTTDNTKIQVLNHMNNSTMYGTGWDSASAWLSGRWEWGDYKYSIWISKYDCWGGSTSWGGSSTPSTGSTFDGYWAASDTMSIRTTFESWGDLTPRTYFYENTASLSNVTSDLNTDTNFRWYPQLNSCAGTSFGISAVGATLITIDAITATNMNETDSYVETFDAQEEEETDVIYLVPNEDNNINGQIYRFQTDSPETSYAKIENGKLILKMGAKDVFWIPSLTVKDATSAYTFENMTTETDDTRLQVLNHMNNSTMYGTGWDSASGWLCGRWEWGDYNKSIWINNRDCWGGSTSWGGSSKPNSGSTFTDGNWGTSDTMSVRTTFEIWDGYLVPRTYFYENTASLSNVTSDLNTDTNFRWYPHLNSCAGTSFGISVYYDSLITIDAITATNMNEKASYVETFDAPGVSNAQVALTLDGTIGLNFKFEATNLPADATVVVTKNGAEIATQPVVNGENVVTAPVNAKEMTDDVNFSIQVDGELFDGQSYTVSVKEYATALLGDAEWGELMAAMLNYGAAAQMLLDYNTNDLAADLAGFDYDMSEIGAATVNGDLSNLATLYATLTLESDTALNLYFKTKNGEALTFTVNGDDVAATTTEDGFIRLTIADIAADQLADEFVIIVNGGEITVTISAVEWAKTVVNGDESAEMQTLAKALAAYADAAKKKINKLPVSFNGQIASAADIAALRLETDQRKAEIQGTANLTPSTGMFKKVYYVSSSEGSDSNNGTSSSTPFKTIAKVNETLEGLSSWYSATVCFKRGDTWRGEQLVAVDNLTVTAYGTGAKPVIMGSPEDGGGAVNASKWTEVSSNIWRYEGSNGWSDVGNIVFNNGECYATKIIQLYVKQESWGTYQITDYTNAPAQKYSFNSYADLKNDLDFFHDKDFSGGSGATGYLYMYSTSNPALRFESIEFATDIKLAYVHQTNGVTIDNICFKYTGAHAVAGDGTGLSPLENLCVQNCEFYWIGGSIQDRISQNVIGTNTVAYDLRYGNAIEVYGACDGFIAQNNYIYQVFDAGITIQKTVGDSGQDWSQKNIQFVNNVIEYCNYSIEYFLTKIPEGTDSSMENFVISGNYMWNAGYGFCETRMIWGRGFAAHIKSQFTAPCNKATGFEISDNVMIGAKDGFLQIRNSYGESSMPLFENNEFYGYYDFNGNAAEGFRLGEVRVKSDDSQEWVSYDGYIEAYLEANMGDQYGEGNKYYFMF